VLFEPVMTSVSAAFTCIIAPLRRCVIVRMWRCGWKSLASSLSSAIKPAACLNAISAISFVGAISRNSAAGRSFMMSAVTMTEAADELFEFFFGTRRNTSWIIRRCCSAS